MESSLEHQFMRLAHIRDDLLIIVLFTLLSLLYTYPLILNFRDTILGVFYDDPQVLLWNMWWTKKSIIAGDNPFFTHYVAYPLETNLTFTGVPWVKNILSIPLQIMFGLIPTYNILMLSTFVLSGFGTYKVMDYLIQDKFIAVISGLIYAFCSYRMNNIFFLNALSTEYIPFYMLFLFRGMMESDHLSATLSGLILSLSFYDHPYYTVFLLIFTFFYVGYLILIKSLWLKGILISLTVFFAFSLPLLIAMTGQLKNNTASHLKDMPPLSLDLLSPIVPFFTHPIKYFKNIYYKIDSAIYCSAFVGFIPLGLMFFSVKYLKTDHRVAFWWFVAVIFFILALGPYLKLSGNINFSIGKSTFTIPMPYQLLYYSNIPGASMIRFPCRFAIIMMFAVAVLSGYGLKYFSTSTQIPLVLIFAGIMLESLALPFPIQSKEYVHPFYKQIAKEENNFSLLDIPYGFLSSNKNIGKRFSNVQYYQTIHNKPIFSGAVSYMPIENIDYFERLPFFSGIIDLQNEIPVTDISPHDKLRARYLFQFFDIKYILIHNVHPLYYDAEGMTMEATQKINQYVLSILPVTEIWSEDERKFINTSEKQRMLWGIRQNNNNLEEFFKGSYEILSNNQVYKIYQVNLNPETEGVLFDFDGLFSDIHLVSGWSDLESDSEGTSSRWADKENSALLFKIENEGSGILITFRAKPFMHPGAPPQEMNIAINDKFPFNYKFESLEWNDINLFVPKEYLKKGVNSLNISYRYSEFPKNKLRTSDQGKLSVAFRSIKIKEIADSQVHHGK